MANQAALKRLEEAFRPANDYNRLLFSRYLEEIRQGYVKNVELPVSRQWARFLEIETAPSLESWREVLTLSDRLKIHHTGHPEQGCPVVRTARALVRHGELASRKEGFDSAYHCILGEFSESLRPVAHSFHGAIMRKGCASSQTTKILRALRQFESFCHERGTDCLIADAKLAQQFMDQLPSQGVSDYREHWRGLRRFYVWAMKARLTMSNPFEKVTPTRLLRRCNQCGKSRIFEINDIFCSPCYVDILYRKKLTALRLNFRPVTPYNAHLWDLYLTYIRRYQMTTFHMSASILFARYLERDGVPALVTWRDIIHQSKAFESFAGRKSRGGCPIEKIGRMLQELGVLGIREEQREVYYENEFNRCDESLRTLMTPYLAVYLKGRRSYSSALMFVRTAHAFQKWLISQGGSGDLRLARGPQVLGYLDELAQANRLGVQAHVLGRFYRFLERENQILTNPFESVVHAKNFYALEICSPDQIKKLARWVRSPSADPEQALLIALCLYWGMTAREMAWATLEILEGAARRIKVIFHRGELTYGNKQHRREQTLMLPAEPAWCLALQARYATYWQERFSKIPVTYPRQPLFLHKQLRSSRPLRTLAIQKRFVTATRAACGIEIPIHVVRRTCGHIYSIHSDASILTRLGWSQDYCVDFLWRPRRLYSART
jgi:site-specific recombinase XerD